MFKPAPMSKIYVLGLKDRVEQVTATLAESQLLHLERVNGLTALSKSFKPAKDEELERRYRAIEEQFEGIQDILGREARPQLSASDLGFDIAKEASALALAVGDIHRDCDRAVTRGKELQEEDRHLAHVRHLMDFLSGLDVDLSVLKRLRYTKISLGLVASDKMELLREGLRENFLSVDRKVRAGEHLVLIAGEQEDQPLLDKVLTAAFFQELVLPSEFLGNPKEIGEKIRGRQEEISKERDGLTKELAALRKRHAKALGSIAKKLAAVDVHFFARDHFRSSRESLVMSGWLPKAKVGELRAFLSAQAEGKDLTVLEDEGAKGSAPTQLRNAWLIRPFENILKIYGTPNYREADPTLYTTVGFMLMFGMMFGDIGHGLFLGSIGAWLRWGRRFAKSMLMRDVGFLLLACGTVSTVFGFLYGSIFGFEHIVHHLWFNPFHQLHYGLSVAIAWGVLFIVGGALLNIFNRVSNGHYIEAVFGRTGVAGIWFYLGSVALIVGLLGGVPALKTGMALWGLCLIPLFLVGMKEPLEAWHHAKHSHGEGPKQEKLEIFILAFMEMYETILTYLSNTLSFMRVAAFALNHVALLLAVFAIAEVLRDATGSGVSYWLMVGVGNLAVIGLEGMIVTIQTFRLIYYEGFSKFFSGDGVAYRPFSATVSTKP